MARTPQPELEEAQLKCLGLIRAATPLIRSFDTASHPVHGNVGLQITDALFALLPAFFNPTVRSLRLIEQLSQMSWVQGHLNVERVCRSTLSDAFERFDPQQLLPLIQGLMKQVPHLQRIDGDLEKLCRRILAADGSYFTLAGEIAWALMHTKRDGAKQSQCRLNLQLDIDSFTPADLSVSGQDEGCEPAAFLSHLASDVIYLLDRNFIHFDLLCQVLERNSDFVLRLRKSTNFQGWRDLPLCAKDIEAGVISDRVGVLPGGRNGRTGPPPQRPLREVVIRDEQTGESIRLLTSLMDVPAYIIGLLYRHRWQVELFFRWLKVWAGFEHLISRSHKGITMQFYVAVIACLMMHIRTGRKVNKYMLFLMGQVAAGLATFEQILPLLERVEREKELERKRRARKKMLSKNMPLLPE
jgi:hypothetical protein